MKYDQETYTRARDEMVLDILQHVSAAELGETLAEHITTRLPQGFRSNIQLAKMDDGELFETALEMKGFIQLMLFRCRLLIDTNALDKYITNEMRVSDET